MPECTQGNSFELACRKCAVCVYMYVCVRVCVHVYGVCKFIGV